MKRGDSFDAAFSVNRQGQADEPLPEKLMAAYPTLKTFCRVVFSGFEEGDSPEGDT